MAVAELEIVEEKAGGNFINILIVIDTEYIKKNYPKGSKDKNNPTGIDHNSQRMIVTGDRGIIEGQGTADLKFKAAPGDLVAFAGTSIYDNSEDAIIIYGIKYWKGDKVFGQFTTNLVTRNGAVVPIGEGDGLPPNQVPLTFATYDSRVSKSGTENFYVYIALYALDEQTRQKQELFGYYYWDPAITVAP